MVYKNQQIIEEFIEKFIKIKNRGWVKSHRQHNTGIGKTFEDLMGIKENNTQSSDFKDCIEIKTQRKKSASRVTLFTKSPNPKGVNTKIKDMYGQINEKGFKEIHTTINALDFNTFKEKYGFKVDIDSSNEKINILVKELNTGAVNKIAYYDFSILKSKLINKHKNTAYIEANHKTENESEYFKFEKLILYYNVSFEKFLEMIGDGTIVYDIRIGTYGTGKNKGKTHDHGSGFRCMSNKLDDLFSNKKIID